MLYGTLMGGVGSMLPFLSREDWDFFSHLEMHMRQELPPMSGRDHLAYRGYYFPVKDVIDGDLCEQYPLVSSHSSGSQYQKPSMICCELYLYIHSLQELLKVISIGKFHQTLKENLL